MCVHIKLIFSVSFIYTAGLSTGVAVAITAVICSLLCFIARYVFILQMLS